MPQDYIFSAVIAFIATYLFTPLVERSSHALGIVDKPGKRKVHKEIVARGGGVAIFFGFLLSLLFINGCLVEINNFIFAAFLIIFLGVLDDKYNLNPFIKLFFQSVIAIFIIQSGVIINIDKFFGGRLAGYDSLSAPLTFLWIVGITNAINIIDGLDGLAAGVSAISAFTIAAVSFLTGQPVVGAIALSLGAAALGFIPHNMKSKIFMGDSGSMFLGFSLATLSVVASIKLAAAFSFLVPIMILFLPIFDTLFAILRRVKNKEHIFRGDRRHLHHRLLDIGFSPRKTVFSMYLVCVALGMMAVLSTMVRLRYAYYIFGAAILGVTAWAAVIVYFHHKVKPKK